MTFTSNNYDSTGGFSLSAPASTAFNPGDEVWTKPPGFTSSGYHTEDEQAMGTAAHGAIGASGEIRLVFNDQIIATQGPGDHYYLSGVPAGATESETYPDRSGDNFVEFKTETGGIAEKALASPAGSTHFSPTFGLLVVTILDANGDRVPKSKVDVGSTTHSTNAQGQVVVEAGGTVTVSALFGTISRDVTLDADTDKSLSWQFHGVEGQVRTPTGGPIANAPVYLAYSDGSILSRTRTADDGTYEFPIAPIDLDMKVASEPFVRDFATGAQGDSTVKNLPFNTEEVGAVKLDFTDGETGDPVVGLPTAIEGALFSALSNDEGEVALIEALGDPSAQQEVEIEIGKNDARYQTTSATVTLVAGDTVEATLDLERETAVVNT